jgi:hypothetical protein
MGYKIEWERVTGETGYHGAYQPDGTLKPYVFDTAERADGIAESIWFRLCATYDTEDAVVRVVAEDGTIYSEWEV